MEYVCTECMWAGDRFKDGQAPIDKCPECGAEIEPVYQEPDWKYHNGFNWNKK